MDADMQFAAAASRDDNLKQAVDVVVTQLRESLASDPDLLIVFVSHAHRESFNSLSLLIQQEFPSALLLGATGETVVFAAEEWESGFALAVWAACLPEYHLRSWVMEFESTQDGVICSGIPDDLAELASRVRAFFLLGEPYSTSPATILQRLGEECPQVPILGGMASGARGAGENRLFHGPKMIERGAVMVALCDGPPVYSVVSQGCRPVGEPFVVTKAERNIVIELGGKPALQRVQEVYHSLSPEDRTRLESGLFLGLAVTEYRDTFGLGDFLVSNVLGADRNSGAITTGQTVRRGQTVQFHVRDAASADTDLRQLLQQARQLHPEGFAGGLLFSCNGRGSRLFAEPHHDAALIQSILGPLPLAGMFAAGEFGPVGTCNAIHGFTASLALFSDSPP